MDIEPWDRANLLEQEQIVGRLKGNGAPLGQHAEFDEPDFDITSYGVPLIPKDSHVRLAHEKHIGVRLLRRGGTATILGMLALDQTVGMAAMDFLSGKTLQGAKMGSNRFPVDMPRLVDFYMRGLLDLDTIIAERIPLEAINEGFEKMKAGHSARSVIVFDQ